MLYYENEDGALYSGDACAILKSLHDQSVNCCVTSPPYWGLRDYGTAEWEGGDSRCNHVEAEIRTGAGLGEWSDNNARGGGKKAAVTDKLMFKDVCAKCGAKRIDSQLGIEKTPEEYVENMVAVFREVRRVLRDDGTLWMNLGDSYWGGKGQNGSSKARATANERGYVQSGGTVQMETRPQDGRHEIFKPKDLIGIPWCVAFALQADGWYLRQDIIWHKPNPMPESVKDRCTKAHEYIFLMSKNARYYYDQEAIKEDVTGNAHARGNGVNPKARNAWKTPDGWDTSKGDGGHGSFHKKGREKGYKGYKVKQNPSFSAACNKLVGNRNKRSVWSIPSKPFPQAHFATFPPALIEPCILAGCPAGGTVLDPFIGSGTTAIVAHKNNRKFIGIELSQKYLDEITIPRIEKERQQLKLFA